MYLHFKTGLIRCLSHTILRISNLKNREYRTIIPHKKSVKKVTENTHVIDEHTDFLVMITELLRFL